MIDLSKLISVLSIDEKKSFINHLEKKNKRNDFKNIQLFKLLIESDLSSKEICFKIYCADNKTAFHALRKRLFQSLIDFIANVNLEEENSVDMQIIKYIISSRTFLLHEQYNIAYKILDKAEALADENQLFTILNEIYHTKIQYAYANPSVKIDQLIHKFKVNQQKHYLENELNIVYAKIRQALNNATYNGEVINLQILTENTLKEHGININESFSFKSLYQLITILSISSFQNNDYLKIEPFLIETYKTLRNYKSKSKQVFYHIQVLYLISNTLFRNKKFKNSIEYLNSMHDYMHQQKRKYYNGFKLKYNLLLALNYNYSNNHEKAITLLQPFITKKHPDLESLLDIYLSLIVFYFQQNELKEAQKIFSKFYHTDKWYAEKAGKKWIIKKSLIEILLHIELGNIDIVESRLLSFKRNYYPYLKEMKQEIVITYLSLVELYYKKPDIITTKEFTKKVEISFKQINIEEDIFIISFYAWLKAKMIRKDVYTTTLNIIHQPN